MKILFINTLYDGGGAEKIAKQLYQNIKKYEITKYIVGFNTEPIHDENVKVIYNGFIKRVFNRIITKNHSNMYDSLFYSRYIVNKTVKKEKIDLIHLHNVHGHYLGISDVAYIAKKKPVIWTIHDCWVMTGHCVSPFECQGYFEGCCKCTHLNYYTPIYSIKKVRKLFEKKYKAFRDKNIIFVTPSKWLKKELEKKMLTGERIEVIYNGININEFQNLDKHMARKKYELPKDKKIVGFIAAQLGIKQKGLDILLRSLKYIKDLDEYHFVIAGANMEAKDIFKDNKINYTYLGKLDSSEELSQFYSSLDILVNPSLAETFGLVNVESMSCGTPVVVFDIGPMREIVDESVGWIVKKVEDKELASEIDNIFKDRNTMKDKTQKCREYAIKNFSLEKMENAYQNLYETILS